MMSEIEFSIHRGAGTIRGDSSKSVTRARILRAAATIVFAVFFPACSMTTGTKVAADWRYDAVLADDIEEISVTADLPGAEKKFQAVGAAENFLDAELLAGDRVVRLTFENGFFVPTEDIGSDWRLRYRFKIADAARASGDFHESEGARAAVISPSAFLLHPERMPATTRSTLSVRSSGKVAFASGTRESATEPGASTFFAVDTANLPYGVAGSFAMKSFDAAGCRFDIAFCPGQRGPSDEDIESYVRQCAEAVGGYYGGFPVKRTLVVVTASKRHEIAMATGVSGTAIYFPVGMSARRTRLERDWVLTHEMVHLAMPNLATEHHWLEEGLASYVEPIARAQAGIISVDEVWRSWISDMSQGQAEADSGGLDADDSWGRTYWGGAAFCLFWDAEIRARTAGKFGLSDALKGVVTDIGSLELTVLDIGRIFRAADRAVGVPVGEELYRTFGVSEATLGRLDRSIERSGLEKTVPEKPLVRPMYFDFDGLWRKLGVRKEGRKVVYDDAAPWAAVRKAMVVGKK